MHPIHRTRPFFHRYRLIFCGCQRFARVSSGDDGQSAAGRTTACFVAQKDVGWRYAYPTYAKDRARQSLMKLEAAGLEDTVLLTRNKP